MTFRGALEGAATATGVHLRGLGQVMLQNHPVTGLVFLGALTATNRLAGLAALCGLVIATGTARLCGAPHTDLMAGLFGFNGVLVGVALAVFVPPGRRLVIYVVAGAVLSTIVMMAVTTLLEPWALPALTAQFCIVATVLLAAAREFGHLQSSAGVPAESTDPIRPVLTGLGQVFLQPNPWTGLGFLAGLAICSLRAAGYAVLGCAIATATAWLMGADPAMIGLGLYGYNGALTAIALDADRRFGAAVVTFAGAASGLATAGLTALIGSETPVLTWPFVVVTWLFLAAAPGSERSNGLRFLRIKES